jgi:hypothetical protein
VRWTVGKANTYDLEPVLDSDEFVAMKRPADWWGGEIDVAAG